MKQTFPILLCCFIMACCSGNSNSDNHNDNANDSINSHKVALQENIFAKLLYPDNWIFSDSARIVRDDIRIGYPELGLHYKSFDAIARRYGAPDTFRRMEFHHGQQVKKKDEDMLQSISILKNIKNAEVTMFHWNDVSGIDSISHYTMDLYFLPDGDSLRVFYGYRIRKDAIIEF